MTPLQAIVLLLRSLNDLSYEPPTSTGQIVQRQSRPGEGPSTIVACGTCAGEAEVRRRGIAHPCPNPYCKDGKVVVDAYTLRQISTEERSAQRLKAVRCDACSGHGAHANGRRCHAPGCNGSGWVEVPVSRLVAVRAPLSADAPELGAGDPVLACLERRERAGDYETLGLALAALRLELPRAYRTVVRVYVETSIETDELGEAARLRHDIGLAYLRRLMPEEIRVPAWAARNERRRREGLKRRAKEAAA